jgi:2-iminobutanoate/2-iminopropanoate deaminase
MRKPIRTDKAPKPAAAYEQAILAGDLIFVSGQVANDVSSGKMVEGTIGEQVKQALRNIEAILDAVGSDRYDNVRCGVYLTDLADFAAMNQAYSDFFATSLPARTTVQAGLGTLRVEIDAIAMRRRKSSSAKVPGNRSRSK